MRSKQAKKIGSYTSKSFPYDLDFENIDFRKNPELYEIGKGEQGVLAEWFDVDGVKSGKIKIYPKEVLDYL